MTISQINSQTARYGYREERLVCEDLKNTHIRSKFSNTINTEYGECSTISGNSKTDVKSDDGNLKAQIKKGKKGHFQQLDRHWIDNMIEAVPNFNTVSEMLKSLCEIPLDPENPKQIDESKERKKLDNSNYSDTELINFIQTFNNNKRNLLNYAFLGTNEDSQPDYLIYVEYEKEKRKKIVVFKISEIINHLVTLNFEISPRKTGIRLGDGVISLQRKGGDNKKKTGNQLQFKIIVSKLIDQKIPNSQYIF